MEKIIPFMIGDIKYVPSKTRRTFIEEIALSLCVLFEENGSIIKKWGTIETISLCFWPVRLIPLSENRTCITSYLFQNAPKVPVGPFKKIPLNPEAVIKASDPESFVKSLISYDSKYLSSKANFSRKIIIQEALFGIEEINFFKPFFNNKFDLKSFEEKNFILSGDPITKSVNQINIRKEIYDFINFTEVKILDQYNEKINKLCDKWIEKTSKDVDNYKIKTIDHQKEEEQLERLNKELREEKERDLHDSDEELLNSGKFKINDTSSVIINEIESLKKEILKLGQSTKGKNLLLIKENIKNSYRECKKVENSITQFDNELTILKRNLIKERNNIQKNHNSIISSIESNINSIQAKMNSDEKDYNKEFVDLQDILKQIQKLKQKVNNNFLIIKEMELDQVQKFLHEYTLEIKTENVIVGIPIFIFNFRSQKAEKVDKYMPVLPILISEGKKKGNVANVKSKIKTIFTDRFIKIFNKYKAMKDLISVESKNNNILEINNLTSLLLESIDELRMKELISNKIATNVKDLIESII